MEICKAPTLWLKALNMHNITHIMHIEIQNGYQQFNKTDEDFGQNCLKQGWRQGVLRLRSP